MKILILSCNTGAGHNSVATAVKENFERHDCECEIFDALSFISGGFSAIISFGHSFLYQYFPELIGNGLKNAGEDENTLAEGRPERLILDVGVPGLLHKIKSDHYDMIICSHMFATIMLSDVVKRGKYDGPTARIETDYMIDPGSAYTYLDACFLPSTELKREWDEQAIKGLGVASGLPVRSRFYERHDKARAKEVLGIAPNSRHLVIMGGSMGAGPLPEVISYLAQKLPDDTDLSIVCGNNKLLHRHLLDSLPESEHIHLHGFCDFMPLLLDSAELYMTKPGGISITEAAVKKVPMVLIDAVGGCEEPNMHYFVDSGYAISGKDPEKIASDSIELLADDMQRREMSYALEKLAEINRPDIIYETMMQLYESKTKTV
jgi:processive 1,2-diacylglycerol beta-glucosyltransferase